MPTLEIGLPTDQYRSMPIPGHTYEGKPSKIATCYVRATDLPSDLEEWMDVNPRMPTKKGERRQLAGRVARRIVKTLQETPALFALKNQGIYLLVQQAEHNKMQGGDGVLTLRLTDKKRHGIVNGGHTFSAIQQALDDEDTERPSSAWVRLHILEQVDPEHITELAEGLNRSLQVDDASLNNLEGKFDELKAALNGKYGADRISYKMGMEGDVDVQDVLSYITALNLDKFPDDGSKHPNGLFGQPTVVLADFVEDMEHDGAASAYRRMLPHLHEILVLQERVMEECAHHVSHEKTRLSLIGKQKNKEKRKKQPRPCYFAADRSIERKIFTGLAFPIFAAFRANVSKNAWASGKFEWIVDPTDLLLETIDQLCDVVRRAYSDASNDPAFVGKKQAAYLACYQVVQLKLARMGKLIA